MVFLLTCASLCSIRNRRSLALNDENHRPSVSTEGRINPNILRQISIQKSVEKSVEPSKNKKTDEENSYTNVKMRPDDQQMTISNFNSNNHVNLVKVKKIDTDNMISLDIISANCYNGM